MVPESHLSLLGKPCLHRTGQREHKRDQAGFGTCVKVVCETCLMMSLPKPVMRGLLAKRLRFHLPIAFALSIVAAAAFKYAVTEPRKKGLRRFLQELRRHERVQCYAGSRGV
ncbi:hypothetical protein GJAV_G00171190 [Gymnothorax javanicus]|nr:hypothetical protein GJAV_G00171190 [Gymnothorax javanicus]